MKKGSFFQFFRREKPAVKSVPVSPFFERFNSPNLFFVGFRCPSNQLRIVAMPLCFGQKGAAPLLGEFR
jgi:hypothetical protein